MKDKLEDKKMMDRIRLREFCRAVELSICDIYNKDKAGTVPPTIYLDEVDATWLNAFIHTNNLPPPTVVAFLRCQRRIGSRSAHAPLSTGALARAARATLGLDEYTRRLYTPIFRFYFNQNRIDLEYEELLALDAEEGDEEGDDDEDNR